MNDYKKHTARSKQQAIPAEALVKLGQAPYCVRCDLYMAPLNDPKQPMECRCWGCGAGAAWEWVS